MEPFIGKIEDLLVVNSTAWLIESAKLHGCDVDYAVKSRKSSPYPDISTKVKDQDYVAGRLLMGYGYNHKAKQWEIRDSAELSYIVDNDKVTITKP